MSDVRNPILRGFHPDPSIVCVGEDFYIATSTFEWFPGVEIHHSKDLVHWELLVRPLCDKVYLDLNGVPCSGGVWAPCLTYDEGVFYLVYSNVHNYGTGHYDVGNYLITASDIMGPWSEPVFLNASGFDPSMFHDTDGKKYVLNMLADFRAWKTRFAGIVLQEYSSEEQRLVGERKVIFRGTPDRTTEGPHIFKKDGYYYLICAEGGTGVRHQAIVQRSKYLTGPYEPSPYQALITSYPYPLNPLQKSGHAGIAQGPDGAWYLAHLCSRPVGKEKLCILGRETALQRLMWKDGWPRLLQDSDEPLEWIHLEDGKDQTNDVALKWRDDFNGNIWNIHFQSLREPLKQRISLDERKGYLRLYGKESLESCYGQSMLAVRQEDFYVRVTTKLDFQPENYQQMAGLTYYYDVLSHYYAYITWDEDKKRVLTLMLKKLGKMEQPIGVGVVLPLEGEVYLRLETRKEKAQFLYSLDGENFEKLGTELDATVLSDDYYEFHGYGNRFTGAFIGICCQDLDGWKKACDFDFFEYEEMSEWRKNED